MVDHTQETWALSGDGYTIYARCPKYFAAILHVVLNGWTISKADANSNAQLAVAFTDGGWGFRFERQRASAIAQQGLRAAERTDGGGLLLYRGWCQTGA